MRVAQIDPSFFKHYSSIKEALKELKEMYDVLDFTEIDDVLAGSRERGKYDKIVESFQKDLEAAVAETEDLPKFGIKIDLEGKSVAAVRAGLQKSVEKANAQFRVVAPKGEAVYLIWMNQ
jgi:hypothetical protein